MDFYSYLFIYYLKILPNWRVSEAIPSKTEPVPCNVPLIVPQEKSIKFKINSHYVLLNRGIKSHVSKPLHLVLAWLG